MFCGSMWFVEKKDSRAFCSCFCVPSRSKTRTPRRTDFFTRTHQAGEHYGIGRIHSRSVTPFRPNVKNVEFSVEIFSPFGTEKAAFVVVLVVPIHSAVRHPRLCLCSPTTMFGRVGLSLLVCFRRESCRNLRGRYRVTFDVPVHELFTFMFPGNNYWGHLFAQMLKCDGGYLRSRFVFCGG